MQVNAGQRRAMQDGAGPCRTRTVKGNEGQCMQESKGQFRMVHNNAGQGQLREVKDSEEK
jgi:hypothetical protein